MMGTASIWFCMNGIIFHKDSYLADLNLDSSLRGQFGSLFFFSGVVGKLSFGFLSDKFDKKNIMLLAISFIIVANILLKLSSTNPILIPFIAVIYGIGYSGSFTMIQLLIADFYFGRYYGRILGFFLMADMLAGTIGVYLLGNWRNASNNYESSFSVLLGISIVAFLSILCVNKNIKSEVN
jgi:MFS family permease